MVDHLTKAKRSWNMSRIKGNDTKPEMTVRSLLHRMGYRFRLHRKDLPGKPDIVLPKYRIVIFVHGCFWHACPFHFRLPRSNSSYWKKKIARNKRRDKEVARKLRLEGWTVVRIWEHQLVCETKVIRRIRSAILKRRGIDISV